MKRILTTASGGPSTLSFTRSLRDADPKKEEYYIVGTDCDRYNIHRSEVDRTYLCPRADDPNYIPFIKHVIEKEGIDFLHSQPEIEAYVIGKHRKEIMETGCRLFMPDQDTIELLRDKSRSYYVWKNAGLKVPENMDINNEEDLKRAFERFGEDIWIRETVGAAGKGSLSRPTYEMALAHINSRNAWGRTVAAEHLTSDTTTWQSIWYEGELVVAQGRKREYWAFSNRAQSGVTGLTGTGTTISDPLLDELSIKCIGSADKKPHGIFSVDFTYDREGFPNPTEINIAKFFTTHHFITRTGCNMPQILVQLAFGEYDGPFGVMNPCQKDMHWIRGIDVIPVLIHKSEIEAKVAEYEGLMKEL
ncbi:MAG: carboxylate--amine ligase [Candidatus Thermoplasmatota archaeon]|nr:carboxylate--amine ligase [Candidatus Thermoplasmatota archaeon]